MTVNSTEPGNGTSPDGGSIHYIVAGSAGGAGVVIFLTIAVIVSFCRCKKREEDQEKEPSPNYSLDEVVVPPANVNAAYVNEEAVDKIHTKSRFNIRKLIGEALAAQIKGLILDSNRLTTGETLGTGNFGVVAKGYLTAENGGGSQTVAVKSITGDEISSKEMKSFIQEILRMRHFNHPNVLNMMGIVIEKNMPKVVMPYMANGDLRSYITNPKNTFIARDLLHFLRQVSEGMQYLSMQNFVHRDLAARNCMVDHNCVVKVADFGLSRDIFNADYYKGDDKAPLPVRWMAIESLKDKKFSTKSDVWSYGVLMWELFTRGQTPYPTLDNTTVSQYVRKGERLKKPDSMPLDAAELMQQCWANDPKKRPAFGEISETVAYILREPDQPPHYDNIK